MSTIAVNAITDANGGSTTSINGTTPNAYNTVGKNLIINGAMQIAQRGTSETGVTSSAYTTVDRFRTSIGNSGTWTVEQSTDAPDGFSNSFKQSCTTADTSPNYLFIETLFEGQALQQLAKGTSSAKSVTLSFWVKCNKTGTAQVNLRDYDNDRLIGNTYTINSADTWEKKSLTFAGDTTGAFDNDNALSLAIEWWFDAGTSFTSGAVPTSWETRDNTDRAAGVTLALGDATSNYFSMTGVQLEVGESATEFEHRPYGTELSLCQRYFRTLKSGLVGFWPNSTSARLQVTWLGMRATPSFSQSGTLTITDNSVNSTQSSTSVTDNGSNADGGQLIIGNLSGGTANRVAAVLNASAGLILVSAEL